MTDKALDTLTPPAGTEIPPPTEIHGFTLDISSDRRADIEAKQGQVAALLRELGRDGLLLLDPDNVAWITAGATPRGILAPGELPAVYCTPEARWLISCNADTQRLFDEEIDGMGFQLKEWPWHWGRDQFLADLCNARKVACDLSPGPGVAGDFQPIPDRLGQLRRTLTQYERACLLTLGQLLAHALEATCRTLHRKDTEREVAGQLAHRLMHRGALPIHLGVAADGRSRTYRRFGFTSMPIDRYAVVVATARKYGLHVTASRTVCFGELPDDLKYEASAVIRVSASYLTSTWPDAVPREVLGAGKRIYQICGFEHEWLHSPQGHVTGRAPVEVPFGVREGDLLQPGWAVVWNASAGAAVSCDTFLVTDQGPRPMTPPEVWPVKRIRVQGAECICPDVLVRQE